MRFRMPVCRGFVLLFIIGLTVIGINVMFLYVDSPQNCVCDCPEYRNSNSEEQNMFLERNEEKVLPVNSKPSSDKPLQVEIVELTSAKPSQVKPLPRLPSKPPPQQKKGKAEDMGALGVNFRPIDAGKPPDEQLQRDAEADEINDTHQLAVLVPFRNRFEEMMEFVPHIHNFLNRQNVRHQIWIINQVDTHRFNRAALLNIGFLLSREDCDYLVMHDIDLLPMNDNLKYSYPMNGPLHISSPELHPLYHYKTFVGGILSLTREQYEQTNGLSNLFWGWGREDDEFFVRMKELGIRVHYPVGITTGYKTFKHIHDKEKRPRDQKRYKNQWEMSKKRDRVTGVNTVQYTLISNIQMTIDNAPMHFVSVTLDCDYKVTPFCDNPS